ncbi:MAG: hypothetical protein E4G91_02630 [Candidatus Zixiibacteriota bacterium]|nr:MAG: hypothetical protein E4G91_02630 [candidate division Zixibacteria bacterium]
MMIMRKRERDHPLLDLTPEDLKGDAAAKLARLEASAGVSREEIDSELRYLRIMSSRKVRLPDDAYFAEMRQRIHERVVIQPVTIWSRLEALLLPPWFKPAPALLSLMAVLLVAVVLTFTYNGHIGKVETAIVAYGPYTPISDSYTEQVSKLQEGQLSAEEIQRYRQILTMSIGILGSPSSLSRSHAFVGSGKRL